MLCIADSRMAPCDGVGQLPENWKISKTPGPLLIMGGGGVVVTDNNE